MTGTVVEACAAAAAAVAAYTEVRLRWHRRADVKRAEQAEREP